MRRPQLTKRNGLLAGGVALLVLILACSTDTPTAPTQVPAPPAPADNNWKITVSVSPEELTVGAPDPALVSATVESRSVPGAAPPNGATMVFSTSIGELGQAGSGAQSIAVLIDQGRAAAFLFAGDVVGTGSVSAQLEGSVGRRTVSVVNEVPPEDPFIISVTPNTGPESGGTRVTITGTGFAPPLRVFFGSKLATVSSADTTRIVTTTPPGDITAADCDDNNDGIIGSKKVATPVQISVENSNGTVETLGNAFTYNPANAGVCVGD